MCVYIKTDVLQELKQQGREGDSGIAQDKLWNSGVDQKFQKGKWKMNQNPIPPQDVFAE